MTNEELIAKIREEVEQRIHDISHPLKDGYEIQSIGKIEGLSELLDFLSTLEEQAKCKVRNPIFDECVANVDPEVREEVRRNIDFEQELYNRFGQIKDFTLGMRIGKYFYELGQQSRPKISDNSLEEEIEKYFAEWEDDSEYGQAIMRNGTCAGVDECEDIARHFYELGCRRTAEKYDEIEYNRQREETAYDTRQYTPRPSVDIEDVARVQFASHAKVFDKKRKAVFDWGQFKEVAGIFYGFGKKDSSGTLESEKPLPNDLEEAARKYQEGVPVDTTIHYCGADEDVYFANRIVDAAIFGAKWQKEQNDKDLSEKTAAAYQLGLADKEKQMLKEAIEGRVSYFESREVAVIYYDDPKGNTMCYFAPSSNLEAGDKVRVIVLPKEAPND